MNKYLMIFILMNLVLSITYVWGADHNRYICAALWFVFPMLNCLLFGLFEKQIEE